MSDAIISVEKLGKKYRIKHQAEQSRHTTLREVLTQKLLAPFKYVAGGGQAAGGTPAAEDFWALKDVAFEVKRGETVGVIGRNGAGKSTLLKILSRITEPTTGRVRLRGRVASLLEVGTGFHQELTGRENIFLNGAILGMSRVEIKKKFDEIVAFAEVEKFLDTPVKRYSSGMYVRLAFAVAAHLEPEILIVDEVLAVGDAQFQKKCLGKMGDVSKKEGRTVLFVSHNMQAVTLLCKSAIMLKDGSVLHAGPTAKVVDEYLSAGNDAPAQACWSFAAAPGSSLVKLRAVRVVDEQRQMQADYDMANPILMQAEFWVLKKERITVSFWLNNHQEITLFATANYQDPKWSNVEYEPGLYSVWCTIPGHLLNEGRHYVTVVLTRGTSQNEIVLADAVAFNVSDRATSRADYTGTWLGVVRPLLPWGGERMGSLDESS